MKRNPNATCGTCPYCDDTTTQMYDTEPPSGFCRIMPKSERKPLISWCGQHPDFAAVETDRAESDGNAQRQIADTLDKMLALVTQRVDGGADADYAKQIDDLRATITRYSQAYKESLEREQKLRADIAARDAVIAECVETLEYISPDCDERDAGVMTVPDNEWDPIYNALGCARALTPSPLYRNAARLLEAAEAVAANKSLWYDRTEKIMVLREALEAAIDAAKGESHELPNQEER